jgi:hypothetical protein
MGTTIGPADAMLLHPTMIVQELAGPDGDLRENILCCRRWLVGQQIALGLVLIVGGGTRVWLEQYFANILAGNVVIS